MSTEEKIMLSSAGLEEVPLTQWMAQRLLNVASGLGYRLPHLRRMTQTMCVFVCVELFACVCVYLFLGACPRERQRVSAHLSHRSTGVWVVLPFRALFPLSTLSSPFFAPCRPFREH